MLRAHTRCFRAGCRGKDFFDACGSDSFCSSYLGSGAVPYQTVVDLHDKLDGGQHCTQLYDVGITSEVVASWCGQMLRTSSLRELLPAFIYRLNRCDKHDRGFILTVFEALAGTRYRGASASPDMPADHNELLYNNIKFSELWDADVSLGTIRERDAQSHFMGKLTEDYLLAQKYAGYPVTNVDGTWRIGAWAVESAKTYPHDQYYDQFPETKSNVLVMNGLLVSAASIARS